MKEIIFILSSLSDSHFRKRVEDFIEAGYKVQVYGFKRYGEKIPTCLPYEVHVLSEIKSRNYFARLSTYYRCFMKLTKICTGKLCFYSSLDVAMFCRRIINSPYVYEVCDLTEMTVNQPIRSFLIRENIKAIEQSMVTILTSQGFLDYFRLNKSPNVVLLPNKISKNCPDLKGIKRKFRPNGNALKIGYVGSVRFETIYNFIKACSDYPGIEIHIYGVFAKADQYGVMTENLVNKAQNVFYHGAFKNPDDLASIYASIDLLLCTYTPTDKNVLYAEPNKFYEALYFNCPIIVSKNVFLGDKVTKMNVGYAIDATSTVSIKCFLDSLDENSYNSKYNSCLKILKSDCINDSTELFTILDKKN